MMVLLGHTGFVGSAVHKVLVESGIDVLGVSTGNLGELPKEADLIINCAGNSRKYWAIENPRLAYAMHSLIAGEILGMKADEIIHVSTVDVQLDNAYAHSQRCSENTVIKFFDRFCIVRLPTIVGEGLKKNVVYDILNGGQLRVTKSSLYNVITVKFVAEFIRGCVNGEFRFDRDVVTLAASDCISVGDMVNFFKVGNVRYGSSIEDYSWVAPFPSDVPRLRSIEHLKNYISEQCSN